MSREGKGEVFEYLKWLRDIEAKERLKGFKKDKVKGKRIKLPADGGLVERRF